MSTSYFPGMFLPEEDPSSRFLELFNTFGRQYPDIGQFLEPDDPDLKRYQELASSPTGSEDLISGYLSQLPTREQYKPSVGRRIAAILLGTMSGNPVAAERTAREFITRPYTEAVEDWKLEGSNISSRARLMDAERNRELQALRFGLQTKSSAKKSEYTERARGLAESRRIASEVAAEEERKRKEEDRQQQEQFMNELRIGNRNLQKTSQENLEAQRAWQRSQDILNQQRREEAAADKAADIDKINKRLSAFASQNGIDASEMTALDTAKMLAAQRAKNYKFFEDVLGTDKNGIPTILDDVNPEKAALLRKWINTQVAKLLRGEF